MYSRRKAKEVRIGNITIGGNNPIAVQSMLNTLASDADACVEQAARLDEAAIGIEQVSSVVQSNSATAEQCAAVSESMNKQASGLVGIVQRFTLGKLPADIHHHV